MSASDLDLDIGEELGDYAVGFIDGWYAARGISQPSVADLAAAMMALRATLDRGLGQRGRGVSPDPG